MDGVHLKKEITIHCRSIHSDFRSHDRLASAELESLQIWFELTVYDGFAREIILLPEFRVCSLTEVF